MGFQRRGRDPGHSVGPLAVRISATGALLSSTNMVMSSVTNGHSNTTGQNILGSSVPVPIAIQGVRRDSPKAHSSSPIDSPNHADPVPKSLGAKVLYTAVLFCILWVGCPLLSTCSTGTRSWETLAMCDSCAVPTHLISAPIAPIPLQPEGYVCQGSNSPNLLFSGDE